jgi:serine/threonine protein kinase
MLSGTLPFSYRKSEQENNEVNNSISLSKNHNNNYELQYSIVNKNPKKIKKISSEAKDLLQGLLNKDPKKRLTIEEILNHPWLKKENNCKYKLFTKPERIMLKKNYIDYRLKGNEDLKESFSISNLNTKEKDGNYNIKNEMTKSSILAPYNTLIENESLRLNENGLPEFDNGEKFNDFNNNKIKMENDIINIGHNVKQVFINFEFNNNGELDNGMIIQSKSKSNTFINLSSESDSSDEINENNEDNIYEQNSEKINKIFENIEKLGYDREYVKKCVDNNILCYASAVYYLLMNYGNL